MDGLALTADLPLAPSPAGDADAALVRRAADGDTVAFEHLYRRHAGRVHGTILRLVGRDRARAEELTQDAFVQAWRKLGGFRFESAFATWLHRLGVNIALMDLRVRRDEDAMDDEALQAAAGGEVPFCAAERGDLERAVAALPARARAVLVLHDVEGYKHEEISAELGMAVGSSKAQLHRARGLLRRTLADR
ncbi:MAG: sigma-70 family RNA polymerase sigma factor [Proteobacteria bacterium]|nr:sigma-70 family RNA polymerase sigma factor [Pseudomonadota bacterium]